MVDPLQLALAWDTPAAEAPRRGAAPPAPTVTQAPTVPRAEPTAPASSAAALLAQLRTLGLFGIDQLTLRRTRRVMVSRRGARLTVHADFAGAPEPVLRAIVRFVMSRRRVERLEAQRIILAHEVQRPPARRRAPVVRATDLPHVERLRAAHARLNAEHFGGMLRPIAITISGRMKTRLGQYTPVQDGIAAAEIAIGRQHLRRDGWGEAEHTLLHEMVHQWQDETGLPIDHGLAFRRKAREVGVLPRARRPVAR